MGALMSEPTLKCRHTGQDVPYQIHQGLAPMYVFQLNAEGLESDMPVLMDGTTVIDKQTKITP